MSCHYYEGVMLVLCTPLQVKCYHWDITLEDSHRSYGLTQTWSL